VEGLRTVQVSFGGKAPIPAEHLFAFVVDRDVNQPDMAAIVLHNQSREYTKLEISSEVEITIGTDAVSIYKGEIVGLEPLIKGGEPARIVVRAMNRLHRLLRKRKSITFTDKTDEDILKQVVGDAGLKLEWKHEKSITYKHVYQHNQTDLEFLRMRAARMGCHIWCVDTTVHVKQPDLKNDSGIQLKVNGEVAAAKMLKSFTPRLSTANVFKKVTVKGWNPETKELLTGTASPTSSPLGATQAASGAKDHGKDETFNVDTPVWSNEEAAALAKAKLVDSSLSYITGEAEAVGDPGFELGSTVKVTIDPANKDDLFDGRYYVMGITHRYSHSPAQKGGGYVTTLRLARDAHGDA